MSWRPLIRSRQDREVPPHGGDVEDRPESVAAGPDGGQEVALGGAAGRRGVQLVRRGTVRRSRRPARPSVRVDGAAPDRARGALGGRRLGQEVVGGVGNGRFRRDEAVAGDRGADGTAPGAGRCQRAPGSGVPGGMDDGWDGGAGEPGTGVARGGWAPPRETASISGSAGADRWSGRRGGTVARCRAVVGSGRPAVDPTESGATRGTGSSTSWPGTDREDVVRQRGQRPRSIPVSVRAGVVDLAIRHRQVSGHDGLLAVLGR